MPRGWWVLLGFFVLSSSLLPACARTVGFSWAVPAGGSEQQLRIDKYQCAKEAVDPHKVSSYTEEVYILCMEAKGYRRSLW